MTKRPVIKRTKQASITERRQQSLDNSRPWEDYEKQLRKIKEMWPGQNHEDYHNWFNGVYDKFRWTDFDRYVQEIGDKYYELLHASDDMDEKEIRDTHESARPGGSV